MFFDTTGCCDLNSNGFLKQDCQYAIIQSCVTKQASRSTGSQLKTQLITPFKNGNSSSNCQDGLHRRMYSCHKTFQNWEFFVSCRNGITVEISMGNGGGSLLVMADITYFTWYKAPDGVANKMRSIYVCHCQ